MEITLSIFEGYISWLLETVAEFLASTPIIWIVGTLLACLVIKLFISLLRIY